MSSFKLELLSVSVCLCVRVRLTQKIPYDAHCTCVQIKCAIRWSIFRFILIFLFRLCVLLWCVRFGTIFWGLPNEKRIYGSILINGTCVCIARALKPVYMLCFSRQFWCVNFKVFKYTQNMLVLNMKSGQVQTNLKVSNEIFRISRRSHQWFLIIARG